MGPGPILDTRPLDLRELWKPKHRLERAHKVATFGSCFAKHFGCALKERGFAWFDAEPSPEIFLPTIQKKYGYGNFSARTGDIYTVAALRQWVSWAIGAATPPEEMWELKGRFYDPFRPSIEPDGFATPEELLASRRMVLSAIRQAIADADWFIFTVALAEGWVNSSTGYNYAVRPGIVAGEFDSNNHFLKSFTAAEISSDLDWVLGTVRNLNSKIRFLLTVSPLPFIETEFGKCVITATASSKSILRAVTTAAAENFEVVDYFPSYEITTGAPFRGMSFEDDKQSAPKLGNTSVMDYFFSCIELPHGELPAVIEVASDSERDPRIFWSNVLQARDFLRSLT